MTTNEQKMALAIRFLLGVELSPPLAVPSSLIEGHMGEMDSILNAKPATPPAPEGCRWGLQNGYWACYQGRRVASGWFLSCDKKDFEDDIWQLDGGKTPENLRLIADALEMFRAWEAQS